MGKKTKKDSVIACSTPNTATKIEVVNISNSLSGGATTIAAEDPSPPNCAPRIEVNTDVDRLAMRPPNPFHPGDDFPIWECRTRCFLRGVSPRNASSYLISLLDDSALRQLMTTGVRLDSHPDDLFKELKRLFDHQQPPALALEAFWGRRQQASESADTYVGALREIALRAFPGQPADRLESEILKRFTLGVRNPDLYSKFIRKEYTSLTKALEVARGFEAAELARREASSAQVYAVATSGPSPPRHSDRPRTTSPSSCSYCRRFGKQAQRCGHNPPIRPQPRPARTNASTLTDRTDPAPDD